MIIVLSIVNILLLILYGVDFAFYLRNRFCRYHIGRMDKNTWEAAVLKTAKKWINRTPVVKKTDNSRYILIDMLKGEYKDSSIQAFQTASLLLGLIDATNDNYLSNYIRKGKWINLSQKPDSAMLAYAMMKCSDNPESIEFAMDEVYNILQKATDDNGLIAYTGNPKDTARYVDVLGMVCPFLARYGLTYHHAEAVNKAFEQLDFFHDYGMYSSTDLPNHAVNVESKLPIGVYGWGRGTAWYFIGLMDTYKEFPVGEQKEILKLWIKEAAECYKSFQYDDGGFGYILQKNNSFDSSVTAAMAWFYAECAELFEVEEYDNVSKRALEKLRKVTRITGAIDWSQGDTKGIGVFSQTFDIMPFTQGFAIRALYVKDRDKVERT